MTHTVKPHETVYSISRMYGITEDELRSANGIGNVIKIGQILTIPGKGEVIPVSPQSSLRAAQMTFTDDVASLIIRAGELGIKLTFGDVWRTPSQGLLNYYGYDVVEGEGIKLVKREPTSWTLNSKHLNRLAVDFNFFVEGRLLFSDKLRENEDIALIAPLGEFWEGLRLGNKWGGNFKNKKDYYHFEG